MINTRCYRTIILIGYTIDSASDFEMTKARLDKMSNDCKIIIDNDSTLFYHFPDGNQNETCVIKFKKPNVIGQIENILSNEMS